MQSQTIIFFGRSGSGKGTQAQLLVDLLKEKDKEKDTIYIETGERLRSFMSQDNHTSLEVKSVLSRGGLLPPFLPIWIWTNILIEKYTGKEHFVLDGLSRRPAEAPVLHSALEFYKRHNPQVIILNTSKEWSKERLIGRGRYDDKGLDIDKRFAWYDSNVIPTIEYFRNAQYFTCHDVNGEQTVEEVHKEIVEKLKLA